MLLALIASVATLQDPVPDQPRWLEAYLEAHRHLESAHLGEAEEAFLEARTARPEHVMTVWGLACVAAREARLDDALVYLEECRQLGGVEVDLLEWDPDLEGLRGLEGWSDLVLRWTGESAMEEEAVSLLAAGAPYEWTAPIQGPGGELDPIDVMSSSHLVEAVVQSRLSGVVTPESELVWFGVSRRGAYAAAVRAGEGKPSQLVVLDPRSLEVLVELEIPHPFVRGGFSMSENRLVIHDEQSGSVRIHATDDWREISSSAPTADQAHLSPSGQYLVLLDGGKTVTVWDVEHDTLVAEFQAKGGSLAAGVQFSSDGELFLFHSASAAEVQVFRCDTAEHVSSFAHVGPPFALAGFASGSHEVVCANITGTLVRWGPTGKRVRRFRLKPEPYSWMEVVEDLGVLLVGTWQGPIRAFDLQSRNLVWETSDPRGSSVLTHAFRFGGFGTPRDDATGQPSGSRPRVRAEGPELLMPRRMPTVAASAKSSAVWIATGRGGVKKVDAASGRTLLIKQLSSSRLHALTVSSDGSRVLAADRSDVVYLLDGAKGDLLAAISPNLNLGNSTVSVPVFTHSEKYVVVRGGSPGFTVVNAEDGEILRHVAPAGWATSTWSVDADAERLALAADHVVRIVETGTGAVRTLPVEGIGRYWFVRLSPDGQTVWIGSDDAILRIFSAQTGELLMSLDHTDVDWLGKFWFTDLMFHPTEDLAVVLSRGVGSVAAWDTVTGERQWSYTYHASHPTGLEASFDGLGEALYVFGQGPWTSRIVSSLGGQTLADHSASKVSDLLPIGCPGLLLSTSQFGLESRSSKTGRLRWTRQDPKEGGWILRSAGGFLDGSFDAINGGLIDLDGRSVLLREHADVLVDPKRVKAEIAGVAVQSPQVK